jgi:hypothetical protein
VVSQNNIFKTVFFRGLGAQFYPNELSYFINEFLPARDDNLGVDTHKVEGHRSLWSQKPRSASQLLMKVL